ncbi:MAG TPA: hypothetical protein VMG13_16050 [Trebonia sp.]|nr:hypothetical protein [Trebonia sp.]
MSAGRPAVPAGPVQVAPAGFVPRAEQEQILEAALAGIELGGHDRRIAAWMANWDTSTLLTVVSWIVRARAAGPAR